MLASGTGTPGFASFFFRVPVESRAGRNSQGPAGRQDRRWLGEPRVDSLGIGHVELGIESLTHLRISLALWLVSSCWIASPMVKPLAAIRQEVERDEDLGNAVDPDLLPTGASWRYGELGEGLPRNGFFRLIYSRDGRWLAGRTQQNDVVVIDLLEGTERFRLSNPGAAILGLDFSPDGEFLACAAPGDGEPLRLYRCDTGELALELGSNFTDVWFSDDGGTVAALGSREVETYAVPSGKRLSRRPWLTEAATRHALSRDGRFVVASLRSVNRGNRILLYDVETRTARDLRGPNKAVRSAALSPDNLWLAVSYHRDPQVQLWDLRDPRGVRYTLNGHRKTVHSVAFSPDSRFLVSTSWDQTAILWDVPAKKKVAVLEGHREHVYSAAFAPLKMELATGASGLTDNSVVGWDLWELLFPPHPLPPELDSFPQVWSALGDEDPRRSLDATRAIIDHKDAWLENLAAEVVQTGELAHNDLIAKSIEQLSADQFPVREAATRELIRYRGVAERALREALGRDDLPAETRHRIAGILNRPVELPQLPADQLRRLQRALLALEMIESDAALDLLEQVAASEDDPDLARTAAEGVRRARLRQSGDSAGRLR